ncbi:MAG: YjhX family toxin [Proteobacteria bacterium]|nr:YjhX family toxin [Pseudomonadota bacterium]
MNISKFEQRVLHVLAQGGHILYERGPGGKIHKILCVTRDGHVLSDCSMTVFTRLKQRKMIRSTGGKPYQISQLGRRSVRAQLDNR